MAVHARGAAARSGLVVIGALRLRCAIGRGGVKVSKREGDGATPAGRWALLGVMWRADRIRRPSTGLPCRPMGIDDGWCDEVSDRNYNRRIRHPYPASAERLWREDRLYDIVVVLDHNQRPRVKGHGSAVFVHLARGDVAPTAGCIALAETDLRKLLAIVRRGAWIVVGGSVRRRRPARHGALRNS